MKNSIFIAIALVLAGCATSEPTVQTGPNAEVSFDGLHRVDNSAFTDAWADPDADWARYNQLLPGKGFFEYRAVKKTVASYSNRPPNADDEFYLDDAQKKRFEDLVSEVFQEEMGKSTRFTETDTPGPNVLLVRGGLHDIVARVPKELITRGDIFVQSLGEATLVLEVVDSMSGEVLARAVERRALGRRGEMIPANRATSIAETRNLSRRWASTLRDGLDNLPTE